MTQTPYALRYDFRGGVNNTLPDEMIADNEVADARNYVPNPSGNGNLIKRPGFSVQRAGTAGKEVETIWVGAFNQYFTCGDTDTAKDFAIYDLSSGTELYSHTTASEDRDVWVRFGTYDIYNSYTRALKTPDGSNFTAVANFPTNGSAAEAYNNMLFCIEPSGGLGIKLRWSAIADCETWSATNALTFQMRYFNEQLRALRSYRDALVLFSDAQLFVIQGYGTTDLTITMSRNDLGCSSPNHVVSTPHGLCWWEPSHGLAITTDFVNVDFPVLRKLRSTFIGTIQPVYSYPLLHMVYRPDLDCLHIYYPTAANLVNARMDYYFGTDSFWLHDMSAFGTDQGTNRTHGGVRCSHVDLTTSVGKSAITEYIAGDLIEVHKEGSTLTAENGTTITSYVTTKRQPFVSQSASKNARHGLITTKLSDSMNLTYEVFAENATTATQSFTITPETGVVDTDVGINQECRKIQHKITDANNARNELYSIVETGYVDSDVVS